MVTTHSLGFPRIGPKRELKRALEAFWAQSILADELEARCVAIRRDNWERQAALDWIPVGDFSLYDQVLDMSATLGHWPERIDASQGSPLDRYFRLARGRAVRDTDGVRPAEMTKWFDTNYHYLVPELTRGTQFALDPTRLLSQWREARTLNVAAKPVLIGPVTYLWLSKSRDGSDRLMHLPALINEYKALLHALAEAGADWVQMDEPALAADLDSQWAQACETAYHALQHTGVQLLLTPYFGTLNGHLQWVCKLPVAGLHLDAVRAPQDVNAALDWLPSHKVLSLGVIDGRNIWKTDLTRVLDWLEPISEQLEDRLWLASSCSLLHVPVDLERETGFDEELHSWLAFATQKIGELSVLGQALNHGRQTVSAELEHNRQAVESRSQSTRVRNEAVRSAVADLPYQAGDRQSPHSVRAELQRERLPLPNFPTTTIGSFPQTSDIRQIRLARKRGELTRKDYERLMKTEIARTIERQEALGLDVLVHGEAERNDMVEYFGEQLDGFAFSQAGWVQSYGSRCVKPPILYGDIERPAPMTVNWIQYAQALTDKPVKGMLTGPVTLLNWSFVRDDQPRSETCLQLALAIRQEVQDLEAAGINPIQIDEAALREGLPLRRSQWADYLNWAIHSFRVAANGVSDSTQIHTHMCYSEFNDIMAAIADMDADVITIESSRSDMELLEVFRDFDYPNDIGPGVYDIHSPNVPATEEIIGLVTKAAERIPRDRLWVNPDCGLKTRGWEEVEPALANLVAAAQYLRHEA